MVSRTSLTQEERICLDLLLFFPQTSIFSSLHSVALKCVILLSLWAGRKILLEFSGRCLWFLHISHHHHSCSLFRNLQVTARVFPQQPVPSQSCISLTAQLLQCSSLQNSLYFDLQTLLICSVSTGR